MDIVIGQTNNRSSTQYRHDMEPLAVEARLLDIKERRGSAEPGETGSGRVVTLLVPEGHKIPRGAEAGEYRIYLRFVHRRNARF